MKVKNGDIWAVKSALEGVLKLPADKLSARGKYFMAKLGRKLSGPLADIEAARTSLVQQYGEKTPSGYQVSPGEAFVAFQTAFAEVQDIETEVDWSPIMLTEKDGEAWTSGEMMALDRFITFPEPDGVAVPAGRDGVSEGVPQLAN